MQFKLRKRGVATSQEPRAGARAGEKGAVQVEFALVAFTLFLVVFATVEMERMMLVYTTLANSTKMATRYAIVHGYDRLGSGVTGPSTSASHANVDAVVTFLATAGTLDPNKLTITTTYTACTGCPASNYPGSTVSVEAVYAYDPFTVLPLSVNLRSVSQGKIAF